MTDQRFDLGVLEFPAVRELLLERLTTTLGRHAAGELRPFATADEANASMAEARELAGCMADDDSVPAGGAVEVRSWLQRFFDGEHQPETRDLADLKRLLRAAAKCRRWLERHESRAALVAMAQRFPKLDDLVYELESTVDDRGEILSSASVRLGELRREIDLAEGAVRSACQRFVADDSVRRCLQSVEPSWRHGRPVFQVRQEMRQRIRGVLHDRSQSGATLFVEPEVVVEAANQLSDLRAAEHREIQVVVVQVCRGLHRCGDDVTAALGAMEHLDLATARARLIHEDGFVAVRVTAVGPLALRRALHPILLGTVTDRNELVPLDVTLGDPYSMLVITGPNTGGKTVALKTIGLLSLMAMSGVPIPAEASSVVPMFDGVFADIGDEQGISQSLSTFSSHVTRIGRCLNGATGQSLVLLDELGAGTDPEEGSALGYAVLEDLEQRRVAAVVTTHLGRLKEFAYTRTGAENGAMAFDGETLRPLYRLDVGIPGTSHALDIARRVGLSRALVDRARELLGERDSRLETVIQSVQVARRKAEQERQRREELSAAAEATGAELDERVKELEHQRAWLHEEADAVVDAEMKAARSLLSGPLREFQNAPRPYGEKAQGLLAALEELLRGTSLHRRRMQFVGRVKKDDVVYVPRFRKRCTVRKVDKVKEVFVLEVGKMRMEVPFEDVSWLQPLDE